MPAADSSAIAELCNVAGTGRLQIGPRQGMDPLGAAGRDRQQEVSIESMRILRDARSLVRGFKYHVRVDAAEPEGVDTSNARTSAGLGPWFEGPRDSQS